MSEQGEKKQTGKGILVISIIAIVVVAILVGVIIFLVRSQNKPAEEEKRQVLVTEDNVEEVLDDFVEQQHEEMQAVAEGYYTVTMSTTWHFDSGNVPSEDSYVENVESNLNDVYFDIVLADDESQVLYSSPVIPRGGILKNITLEKGLDAGRHEAVCIYSLLDENQNPVSEVRVSVHLVVEN